MYVQRPAVVRNLPTQPFPKRMGAPTYSEYVRATRIAYVRNTNFAVRMYRITECPYVRKYAVRTANAVRRQLSTRPTYVRTYVRTIVWEVRT